MNSPIFPPTPIDQLTEQDREFLTELHLRGHTCFLIVENREFKMSRDIVGFMLNAVCTDMIFVR